MRGLPRADLRAAPRPDGDHVVVYDDDHYYLGGVLAELLVREGRRVTLVTPGARVSEWTINTMEQERIQRRLLESGVTIMTPHVVNAISGDGAQTACTYTGSEQQLACDAVVLVTARDPRDQLAADLAAAADRWPGAGVQSVQAVGDAWSPATIAAAVWDGRRFAEQLEQPDARDATIRREVVRLADAP